MRVLHIGAGNLYGGTEAVLVTLARHRQLCPGLQSHFALCFAGRLAGELAAVGVDVALLGKARLSRPWSVWKVRRRLGQLLRQERMDVVICHGCWPHVLFAPVVVRHRLPLVFVAHDLPSGRHSLERLARRVPPHLVLANSRFTQAALPHLFANAPSQVLYLPVPAPDETERPLVRSRVRAALQTPDNATVIIQASRLERWKGHALLLQALSHLRELPGWMCWIAGGAQRPEEEAYLQELRASASRLQLADRVRFLGQRSDVAQLLAAADIHCQPNTGAEPFGIAFVEALYAGLPVVTTALGGAVEIINATCGRLLPPDDIQALVQALGQLIQDESLRHTLGAAGRARARLLCDPETQMGRLKDLLEQVVPTELGSPAACGFA